MGLAAVFSSDKIKQQIDKVILKLKISIKLTGGKNNGQKSQHINC